MKSSYIVSIIIALAVVGGAAYVARSRSIEQVLPSANTSTSPERIAFFVEEFTANFRRGFVREFPELPSEQVDAVVAIAREMEGQRWAFMENWNQKQNWDTTKLPDATVMEAFQKRQEALYEQMHEQVRTILPQEFYNRYFDWWLIGGAYPSLNAVPE